jgi:hypothetical protein
VVVNGKALSEIKEFDEQLNRRPEPFDVVRSKPRIGLSIDSITKESAIREHGESCR